MGLFLPVLLLGLAHPADQPVSSPSQSMVQSQTTAPALATSGNNRASKDPATSKQPLDRIEPYLRNDCKDDPNCKVVEGPPVCLTMRSYYFERNDDLAPELKGMTTCESVRDVRDRNAKRRQKARMVPAN